LKSRIAVVLLLSIMLVGVIFYSCFAYSSVSANPVSIQTPATSYKSFILTANGQAYDMQTRKDVAVTLDLSGSASGTLQTIINLNVKGGDFNVAGYSDITVSSGNGYIISICKYNQFSLILSGQYGGHVACLFLTGTVTPISSNTLSMSLSSNIVLLPFQGYPILTNLHLTDTITLYT